MPPRRNRNSSGQQRGDDAGAKLVIRNTFIELFDDTAPEAPGGRRPRARTDDLHRQRAPRKVSYSPPMDAVGPAVGAIPGGWPPPVGFGPFPGMPPFMPCPEVFPGPPRAPPLMIPPPGSMPYQPWNWPWMYPPGSVPGPYGYPPMQEHVAHPATGSNVKRRSLTEKKGTVGGPVARDKAAGVAVQQKQQASFEGRGSSAGASSSALVPPVDGTTVMLRNIPNRYTQTSLLALIDENNFKSCYDFVYLPMDFRNGVNLGYAFVNLLEHKDALRLMETFQGFTSWSFDSAKVCEVSWAHPHQGYAEHIERYRNSPVMHPTMPDEYKPMVFKNGSRVPFPPPTKAIRAPKLRPVHDSPKNGQA